MRSPTELSNDRLFAEKPRSIVRCVPLKRSLEFPARIDVAAKHSSAATEPIEPINEIRLCRAVNHAESGLGFWRVGRRKQFRVQTITAAICKHPVGQELRVFLEPENAGNLLHSELARFDFTELEQGAASLREVLLEKGWTELQVSSRHIEGSQDCE